MYTGGFIACLGSAIVAGGAFVFLVLFLGVIFLRRAGAEDKLMEQQFPNEYLDYKKRTKAVIPFVW
jgi:protein-S-isoprenylcysteine O-methyltransferase